MTSQRSAYYYGLAAIGGWSTAATAFKIGLGHATIEQLLLLSATTSWVVLAIVVVAQGKLRQLLGTSPKQFGQALILGLLNPVLYYATLFAGYGLLPAQEALAINYSWPIMLMLMAVPLRNHRLQLGEVVAAIVCYGGVLVIATRGDLLSLNFTRPLGVVLLLLGTLIWAGYWLLNTRLTDTSRNMDPVVALFVNFSSVLPLLLGWQAVRGFDLVLNWQGYAAALWIGLFEMGLTFVWWLMAMRLTASTARISNLIFLSPCLSLGVIYLVLGEPIRASTITGLLLILAGLVAQRLTSKPL